MKKILVTDSLFIFKEHEKILYNAGFEIERLNKPNPSEEELIKALEDKEGYILGWIERVTNKVIESTKKLKVISFTGTDWRAIIRWHELATRKWIHISSTPEANANAVSEYTISIILSMTRNLFELNRVGQKKFETTKTLNDLTVWIIWMWVIWKKVTRMLNCLWVKKVIYYSLNKKDNINAEYKSLE